MGGTIDVESEQGKGSIFHFTITTEIGTRVLKAYTNCNLCKHEGKKVLVVDDNFTNLAILKHQLELWKLIPVLASSALEAFDVLSKDAKFDLVLTDMQMPGMDGISFATTVKKNQPALPVILLSSIGDECAQQNKHLFSSVLTKPVRQHILCKHISHALENTAITDNATYEAKISETFALEHSFEILIAEDNLVNQQVILHILGRLGYTPDLAANGVEVIQQLTEKRYDLILMDMQMPEMDGIETTKSIRASTHFQPLIIALTANTMQGDEEICINAGMNDYLGKPVKLEEVMQKLEKWSGIKKAGRAA